ncbi:MAG: tetratricopeptide repeat protein [Myxococcota bacterium]
MDDSPHNEFDLGVGEAPSLELDFGGGPGRHPPSEPPPGISASESGLDFPAPVDRSPGGSDIDLPSPVGMPPAAGHSPPDAISLDLPAPIDDLPRPAPPRFSAPPSPPGPRPPSPYTPGPPPAGPPAAGLPSFSDDLPAPVDLDLPTPASGPSSNAGFDLPPPPGAQLDDGLDLPIPQDLPAPGGQQMVTPVGQDLAPSNIGVAPSNLGVAPSDLGVAPSDLGVAPSDLGVAPSDLGVAPSDLGVAPSNLGVTPAGPGQATGDAAGSAAPGTDVPPAVNLGAGLGTNTLGAAPNRSPAKLMAPARPPISRTLLVVVGGIAVLGLAAVGVLYSGILDPDDPEPTVLRGKPGKNKPKTKEDDSAGKSPEPAAAPSGPAVERSSAVLAMMAKHTPAAYLEAKAASTAASDAVGAAEGALLLHYHYGPNPALATEAATLLQGHAGTTEAFVQRVIGLSSLAAGNISGAEPSLAADDPRTRLYRGWARLSQGELDQAKADADAVLEALPDELSARHLTLAIAAAREPAAAVPTLVAAVAKNPHPALQALLATTAIETGQLATARTATDALDPTATEDPGVQAWTHVQKARVHEAQGDYVEALAAYDRALELVPQAPVVHAARIRALLAAKRFNDASAAVSILVREQAENLEIQLLQAEVAVQSGDGDIALEILGKLAKAMPKDARVMRLTGEVHAKRLAIDEGQTAFAAARTLDPLDYRVAMSEAILLADARRLPDALAVLETARAAAQEAGRQADVARLLVTKARLHDQARESNAAIEALSRALEAVPTDNEAQVLRGALRLKLGPNAEGRADLVEVFERTGGFPGLAAPLGQLFVLEGNYDALERLVGDRLRGDQTDDELLLPGIRLRLQQGRTEDARTLVQTALTRRPSDWEAHMLLAQLLISEGKASEALAEIERARPATPQAELMLQRGKILEFNARHDDAIPEYRGALELAPDLHEARFLFGRLLHYKGGHGKAITELRRVIDAPSAKGAPWFPEVWLNLGLAQQAQGKNADAITSLREATTLDPELGEAWARMGEFHENVNKHGEAITALNKAVELGTKDDYWYADALMNLGRAQVKAGKKAAANKSLKKFLEVAPPEHTSRSEAERLLGGL